MPCGGCCGIPIAEPAIGVDPGGGGGAWPGGNCCGGMPGDSGMFTGAIEGGGAPIGGAPGAGVCGICICCTGGGICGICGRGGGCAMFIIALAILSRWILAAGPGEGPGAAIGLE
jgi:hypothetical protein